MTNTVETERNCDASVIGGGTGALDIDSAYELLKRMGENDASWSLP